MSNPTPPPSRPDAAAESTPYAPPDRPGTVLAGCIMSWVGAAFGGVIAIALIFASGDPDFQDQLNITSEGAASLRLIAIFIVLWCLLVAGLAVQVFRRKRWAAIALAVMAGIFTIFTVVNMVSSGTPSGLVGVAYAVAAVVLLFNGSRTWYAAR